MATMLNSDGTISLCYVCGKRADSFINVTATASSSTPSVMKPVCQKCNPYAHRIQPSAITSDELEQADETIDIFDQLVRERDGLRAENGRLRSDWQLAVKIAETHATENERLRAELERYDQEIRRLRENRDKAASLLDLANQAIYGLE